MDPREDVMTIWLCSDDRSQSDVLVLIPKVTDPQRLSQFRPIALCNVVYKIISKVLVNRLHMVLASCVDENQGAFVFGRLISDNVILAQDIHSIQNGQSRLPRGAALRLKWKSLDKWEPFGCDSSSAGSVVPFPFVLCAQGLSSLIHAETNVGNLRGICICRSGPSISHLFYADCLFFLRITPFEFSRLLAVLDTYEAASGQKVNYAKSTGYFSPSTSEATSAELSSILGVQDVQDPGSNLEGILQAVLGDRPSYVWLSIWTTIQEFRHGFFRQVGIKSVARVHGEARGGNWPVQLQTSYVDSVTSLIKVGDFTLPGEPRWNESLIRSVFSEVDASQILNCQITPYPSDILIWDGHSSGTFSVKSGYTWLTRRYRLHVHYSRIWLALSRLNTLPRVRLFAWRACYEALPVGRRLFIAGVSDGICHCVGDGRNCLHALRDCLAVQPIFFFAGFPSFLTSGSFSSCGSWLESMLTLLPVKSFTQLMVLLS
ncbi:uncharacterized protein LOC120168083 [Hibiscus syriacus]|uniref:uncharacterized protein LOC120168083 n=1 Tax=Hibiscus syriacus TaxID=106335 RepID=UPI001924CB32|nr:uncharacterized protein LOC120168083 [Hibiscus syriacus]